MAWLVFAETRLAVVLRQDKVCGRAAGAGRRAAGGTREVWSRWLPAPHTHTPKIAIPRCGRIRPTQRLTKGKGEDGN